jgi:hypothetical protein
MMGRAKFPGGLVAGLCLAAEHTFDSSVGGTHRITSVAVIMFPRFSGLEVCTDE